MCELTGFTEDRQRFASTVHADAATIAELNSLRRFASRCETAREVAEEIDARVVAKARRMGLMPDAHGAAPEDAAAARIDDGGDLQPMDEVRDGAGNRGTVAGRHGDNYMVIFDTPNGTRSLIRARRQLTVIHRAVKEMWTPTLAVHEEGGPSIAEPWEVHKVTRRRKDGCPSMSVELMDPYGVVRRFATREQAQAAADKTNAQGGVA